MEPIELDTGRLDAAMDDTGERLRELEDLSERFARTFATSMASAARSGRSFGDTLRSLALSLSNVALRAGLKPLENLLAQGASGLVGALAGGVTPFAKGGVVASPTFFPAGGGIGLMGEAGPEAVLPLRRGSDGRLGIAGAGIAGAGGGGGTGAVNVTVNVSTPDVAGFRKAEAQVAAGLARAVARSRRTL